MQDCVDKSESLEKRKQIDRSDSRQGVENEPTRGEAFFRKAVKSSPTGFAIVSPEGDWLSVNPYFSEMTGYSEKELLHSNFAEITHPDDVEEGQRNLRNLLEGKVPRASTEKRYRHKDGHYVWAQLDISLVRKEDKTPDYVITQIREISARKEAEEKLKQSEERFRQLAETVDEVFWLKDANTDELIYVSPAYERIWGRSLQELSEKPESWMESILPEEVDAVRKTVYDKSQDGNYDIKFRILHTDDSVRWIRVRSFRILTPEGKVDRIVGVARDITQQNNLEEQLAHSQRMESIGALAGGVAHDFNNILTIILGYASLLEQNRMEPNKVLQAVGVIRKTAERGASLVRQLLTLARKVESNFQTFSLNGLAQEALSIARSTFPKSIQIESDLAEEPVYIRADYTQIHQIFVNLILNAKDALPSGGSLTVRVREVDAEVVPNQKGEKKKGKYALLQVEDTGIGMDEETKRKIFDPFFTTKPLGKGTGLGLALVYSILENHEGTITVDSILGEGTIFRVYLPAAGQERQLPDRIREGKNNGIASARSVLLVEDEEMIRDPLADYLSEYGYSSILARDGEEALHLFAEHRNRIQAVVCDLNLPKGNGIEVLKKIRTMDASLPLVLASGYIDPDLKAEIESLGLSRIIQKPYSFETILQVLRKI